MCTSFVTMFALFTIVSFVVSRDRQGRRPHRRKARRREHGSDVRTLRITYGDGSVMVLNNGVQDTTRREDRIFTGCRNRRRGGILAGTDNQGKANWEHNGNVTRDRYKYKERDQERAEDV